MRERLLRLLSGIMTVAIVVGSLATLSVQANAADCEACEQIEEAAIYAEDNYIDADPEAEHPYIKGQCQIPYDMVVPGEDGYLIGFQTYEMHSDWTYEMLILDCSSMAWIYTTGQQNVPEDCFWTVWQPEYGYFWTLFSLRDGSGREIDRVCYGFANEKNTGNVSGEDYLQYEKGDVVSFGCYEGKDIEWYVLQAEGGEMVLLAKDILTMKAYEDNKEVVTWEDCSLRAWLNNEFYKTAFRKEERDKIETVAIENEDNALYRSILGQEEDGKYSSAQNTKDKVYLLSFEDIKKYFGISEKDYKKLLNYEDTMDDYTAKCIEESDGMLNASWYWWLRSPGMNNTLAGVVDYEGRVIYSGANVMNILCGVRPVIRIKI